MSSLLLTPGHLPAPFAPSPQQSAVINWVRDGRGSAFVEAVAGAGKTTTLVKALAETNGSVAFAAYNRKIADEINVKVSKLGLGNRVRIGTFHSFGLTAWRYVHKKVQAGPEAARKKEEMTVAHLEIPKPLRGFAAKLIGLAKQRALGLFGSVDDVSQWWDIVEHFDLAHEVEEEQTLDQGVALAMRGLAYHREIAPDIIDFDDMIYMPIVTGIRMWQNDWVFVDEAQDTNPARRALARKMLKPNGRACFVGDRHQAIYGFTGADNDAIDRIVREFRCVTMPLTVTYRCPKTVVEKARTIVSHIEAHETAPEGKVSVVEFDAFMKTAKTLAPTDAILCRKTKPLVKAAYMLITQGVACHVEGRDIGMGLIKLIDKFRVNTLIDLQEKLEAYLETQVEKLKAKGRETQADALQDRVETIFVIINSQPPAHTVEELKARIQSMFLDSDNERKPTLTLSTVHKAKGREWPRVFVLGYHQYMPSKWARQQWQLDQEYNVMYVAITRAQEELVMINVED